MGIKTIGELASFFRDKVVKEFGGSHGDYFYYFPKGIDESPLVTNWEPKSHSRETTFEKDTGNWQVIAKTLAGLTRDVIDEMKESGYKGKTVTVKVRFSDFETHTRAKTI